MNNTQATKIFTATPLIILILLFASPKVLAGTFNQTQSFQVTANGSGGVAIADFDGDGDNDVIVGDGNGNHIWWNNGTGTLTDSGQSLGNNAMEIAAADFNRDGSIDILTCKAGEVRLWWNNGSGTFTSGASLGSYRACAVADVDNDGDVDIVVGENQVRVFLNNGSGTFTDSGQSIGSGITTSNVSVGDVDNDMDVDIVTAKTGGANEILLNNGSGTFSLSSNFDAANSHQQNCLADVNNDGSLDIISISYLVASNKVWLNNGSGGFTDSGQNLTSGGCNDCSRACATGDIDRDGDIDVLTQQGNNCSSYVWVNNGAGTFSLNQTISGNNNDGAAMGDLDNDGNPDLIMADYFSGHQVFMNQGGPNNPPPNPPTTVAPVGIGNVSSVYFGFNAGSDGQTPQNLLTYNLRIGTTTGSDNIFPQFPINNVGNFGHAYNRYITLPDGNYFWNVQTVDSGGRMSAWDTEKNFTVDTVPPTTTDNWTDNWTNTSPVNITLSPVDALTGVQWTNYCTDGANSCVPGTTGTTPSLTCGAGSVCTQFARYFSRDNANNDETVKSKQVRQDRQLPTTTINTPAAGAWERVNFSVSVTNTDAAGAGLNTCYYRVVSNAVQTLAWTSYVCGTSPNITVGAAANCRDQGTNMCQVEFYNTDLAGNTGTTVTRQFSIDFTNPTTTINSPAAGAWQVAGFTTSVTNADTGGSGLNLCYYRVFSNGAQTLAWTSYACGTNPNVTVGVGMNCRDQGTNMCQAEFYNTDVAGNAATAVTRQFSIDWTAPTNAITAPAAASWQKADFTVTAANADTGGSGLHDCMYRVDSNGAATLGWTAYACGTNPTITVGPGMNCRDQGASKCDVVFYVNDNAGNIGSGDDRFFSIDWTAPAATITGPAPGSWQVANFTASVTNADTGGSNLNVCYYRVVSNGAQTLGWTTYACGTSPTITEGAGMNCRDQGNNMCQVEMYNTDVAGNTSTTDTRQFSIDGTLPTSTITGPAASSWQVANFSVTVTNADTGGSNLNVCYYRVLSNGAATLGWTTYACGTSPTITEGVGMNCRDQGTNMCQVELYNTDVAGNTGTTVTRQFSIDWTAPTAAFASPAAASWRKQNFTLTPTNSDTGASGLSTCFYRILSNGVETLAWTSYPCGATPPIITVGAAASCLNEGANMCSVELYDTDVAGNTGTTVSRQFSIDWTPAVIGGAVTPANTDSGTHVSSPYDLSVGTLSDAVSGAASCEYTTDGGTAWIPVPGYAPNDATCSVAGINCTDGDALTLNFRITDTAGNQSTGLAVNRTCDTVPPATLINSPAAASWQRQAFAVTPAESDARSGLATCNYRVLSNGAQTLAWTPYMCGTPQTLTVGAAANCRDQGANVCQVEFYAVDNVANAEPPVTRTFSIDWFAPTAAFIAPPASTWQNQNFTAAPTNSDTGFSDLATCYYRVLSNGAQTVAWTPYPCAGAPPDITVGPAGQCGNQGVDMCRVELYSVDVAGNTGVTVARQFSMDYTPAIIGGTVTPANSDSGTNVDSPYDLSAGTISDAVSGTDTCEYTTDGGATWIPVPGYAPGGASCSVTGITCSDGAALVFNFRITDVAGNQGTGAAVTRTCDTVPPSTTINGPAASSWHRLDFPVHITNADSASGLKTCYYRVLSNSVETRAWTLYACATEPTITVGPGTDCRDENPDICSVEFYNADNVGNAAAPVSRTFSINWTGPRLQGVITPANNDSGTRVDRVFDLSAVFTDPDGVAGCEFCKSTDGVCDTEWAAASWNNGTNTCSITSLVCVHEQMLALNMRATDLAANVGEGIEITRQCDDAPPPVAITQPATGHGTSNPALPVSAVSEAGVVVVVNGVAAAPAGTNFTANVPLAEGPNTITAISTDAVGNATSTSIVVFLDTIPPVASIAAPSQGESVSGAVSLSGVASDLNFLEYAVYYGPGAQPALWGTAVASATVPVNSAELGAWDSSKLYGTYTIRLAAKDRMNNITETTRQVFVGNTASFTATIPADQWSMIAIPGIPQNPDPHAFLGSARYEVQRWDPTVQAAEGETKYKITFPVTAGDAFWVKPYKSPIPYNLLTWVPDTTVSFEKHLDVGWNQVGTPYNRAVAWSNFQFKRDGDAAAVPMQTAISNGWIGARCYSYTPASGYIANDIAATLEPFEGYYVMANVAGTLLLDPGAGMPGGVAREVRHAWDYNVKISATAGASSDNENYFGATADAASAYDVLDAPEPPRTPAEKFVSLYFPRENWNTAQARYSGDARPLATKSGAVESWTFNVETSEAGQGASLAWDSAKLPADRFTFTLNNLDTGEKTDMSARNAYAYTAAPQTISTAHFRIDVEKLAGQSLTETYSISSPGWRLISLPIAPDAATGAAALGLPNLNIFRYDGGITTTQTAAELENGLAYWVYSPGATDITIKGQPVSGSVTISLKPGWNAIGNPYKTDLAYSDNITLNCDGISYTLGQAVLAGITDGKLYAFDGETYSPAATLKPWAGYFLKVKSTCDMVMAQ